MAGGRQVSPRATGTHWSLSMMARLLGVNHNSLSSWVSGEQYPGTKNLKKLEAVLGWPASEQIDLIPLEGRDMRYSMKFRQVLGEWKEANPRTISAGEITNVAPSHAKKRV